MFKVEPKTILYFLATHFELLRRLFDTQQRYGSITRDQVWQTLKEFDSDIESQLLEHKFLIEQNDDYVINEPYFVLFEFILQQFKPLLPEEVEKHGQAIRELFLNIQGDYHQDRNLLIDRIDALSNQIRKFTNDVKNNTISLLHKSRELKVNIKNIEYHEKIKQANYLIDYYIVPLNKILDFNHSQSIYNELRQISRFTNTRRLDYRHEDIRRQFEKLYNLLRQSIADISSQSYILSSELLPLIDRLKTESEYLQGFHEYLTNNNCYIHIKPPILPVRQQHNAYNAFVVENSKEYLEQFKDEEVVYIDNTDNIIQDWWVFDKSLYQSKLEESLPIDDFFTWCQIVLENDKKDFNFDSYFMLVGLMFESDYEVQLDTKNQKVLIKGQLSAPKLTISKKVDAIS